jgi:uncharacterized protein YkwD
VYIAGNVAAAVSSGMSATESSSTVTDESGTQHDSEHSEAVGAATITTSSSSSSVSAVASCTAGVTKMKAVVTQAQATHKLKADGTLIAVAKQKSVASFFAGTGSSSGSQQVL